MWRPKLALRVRSHTPDGPTTSSKSRGHVIASSSLALYEWLRGPRTAEELEDQEALVPLDAARVFGAAESRRAAVLYRDVRRARGRDMDIAIAACAIEHGAHLWTLKPADFRDLPGVELFEAT